MKVAALFDLCSSLVKTSNESWPLRKYIVFVGDCCVWQINNTMSYICTISLSSIIEYLGNSHHPLREGENLWKSGHVLKVGVQRLEGAGAEILGYVVQTSNIRGAPHEVALTCRSDEDWTVTCSCKAGLGRKCKHAVAVLLYVQSAKVIDIFSPTELRQTWGKPIGKKFDNLFGAKKRSELCCLNRLKHRKTKIPCNIRNNELDAELLKKYLKIPSAAVTIHQTRRTACFIPPEVEVPVDHIAVQIVLQFFKQPLFLLAQQTPELSDDLSLFYLENIAVGADTAIDIERATRLQNSSCWYVERQKRITASTARALYTYKNNKSPNWSQKVSRHLRTKFAQTSAMKYGLECEDAARKMYSLHTNQVVEKIGFVVSPVLPWLGCSPDGFVFAQKKVVEIKSPVLGKTESLETTLMSLKYLDENLHLKNNHTYYAQTQTQMAVLNAGSCDLIIYCSSEQSFLKIEIPFDKEFVNEMLAVLEKVYFTYLLPAIFHKNLT